MTEKPSADDALKAAGMLWLGLSLTFVAKQLGITTGTLNTWRRSSWWPAVESQAESAHLGRMVGKARRVLDNVMEAGLGADATARDRKEAFVAARFLLEHQDKTFKPHESRRENPQLPANLASLSVEELRALARQQPRELGPDEFEVIPRALPAPTDDAAVDFEELAELARAAESPGPKQVRESDDGTLYLDDE